MEIKAIGEIAFLVLVTFVILFSIVLLTPESVTTKVRNLADNTVDNMFSTIKTDKVTPGEEAPKEVKDFLFNLKESFEKTGDKCLGTHPDFKELKDYSVQITQNGENIDLLLMDKKNFIKSLTAEKKKLCIVAGGAAAENFKKYYLDNDQSYIAKPKFSNIGKVTITKDKIIIGTDKFDIEDQNIIFIDKENVCFFPTYPRGWGWGCDADEDGMDNDCIPIIKQKVSKCSGG